MKAQSSIYVQLQNIYKSKARKDVAEVLETVRSHPQGAKIDVAEVEAFCKNAAFIKLMRGADSSPQTLQAIAGRFSYLPNLVFPGTDLRKDKEFESDGLAAMAMMPLSLLPIYLALNATSHVPSADSSEILATISKSILAPSSNDRLVQVVEEVARAKGGELHNISALTGGMVSQEVIKIITKQYIPIDNTCIFDGITSRAQVLRI
jgi:amyloid beta precursor protein binding protein 1